MKKIFYSIFIIGALFACSEDEPVEPVVAEQQDSITACGDKQICFNMNDTTYSSAVLMYKLDDTTYFAKYEEDGKQLSIDWFSDSASIGTFPAGMVKEKGMSRIYWFPENNQQWMSDSGEVIISKHENKTVTAAFSGRLLKLQSGQPTGESVLVKDGVFTNGMYF